MIMIKKVITRDRSNPDHDDPSQASSVYVSKYYLFGLHIYTFKTVIINFPFRIESSAYGAFTV